MLRLSQVPALTPDERAFAATLGLAGNGADSALVLETGRLVGVLYTRDVAEALESGTHHPPAGRSRRSDSRSTTVPALRTVTVPGHETGPPRDAA
jgi:CBS domain-containing protein